MSIAFGSTLLFGGEPEMEQVAQVNYEGAGLQQRRSDLEYSDDHQTCLLDILDTAGQEGLCGAPVALRSLHSLSQTRVLLAARPVDAQLLVLHDHLLGHLAPVL